MLTPDPIVTTDWLQAHLDHPELCVIDIRGSVTTRLVEPGVEEATYRGAPEEYAAEHLPDSVFVDWTADIVDPDNPVPVQLALPDRFTEVMQLRGVRQNSHVVAVDHRGGQFATRLWWVLRSYGHQAVSVLEGGFQKWAEEERPLDSTPVDPPRGDFQAQGPPQGMVEASTLLTMLQDGQTQLLDARSRAQYTNQVRRGPRGGHLPGAISIPRGQFFDESGAFLRPEKVEELINQAGLDPNRPVVAYCNGGVAATAALLQLHRLGFQHLALYDGSWNEWSRREELPVMTDA